MTPKPLPEESYHQALRKLDRLPYGMPVPVRRLLDQCLPGAHEVAQK